MDCFLKAFVKLAPQWHKDAHKKDPAAKPSASSGPSENALSETDHSHCEHCRAHNPLYRGLDTPNFLTGDAEGNGGSGLDALYRLCVCEHAFNFSPNSTLACGAGETVECTHGAGKLFRGHARVAPEKEQEKEQEKGQEGEPGEEEGGEEEGGEVDDEVELEPDVLVSEATATVKERRAKDLAADVAARGVWPTQPGEHGPCPVLEAPGLCRWREYQWVVQHFVDRTGKHRERKNQILVEMSGTRQEFLATFKRCLLFLLFLSVFGVSVLFVTCGWACFQQVAPLAAPQAPTAVG